MNPNVDPQQWASGPRPQTSHLTPQQLPAWNDFPNWRLLELQDCSTLLYKLEHNLSLSAAEELRDALELKLQKQYTSKSIPENISVRRLASQSLRNRLERSMTCSWTHSGSMGITILDLLDQVAKKLSDSMAPFDTYQGLAATHTDSELLQVYEVLLSAYQHWCALRNFRGALAPLLVEPDNKIRRVGDNTVGKPGVGADIGSCSPSVAASSGVMPAMGWGEEASDLADEMKREASHDDSMRDGGRTRGGNIRKYNEMMRQNRDPEERERKLLYRQVNFKKFIDLLPKDLLGNWEAPTIPVAKAGDLLQPAIHSASIWQKIVLLAEREASEFSANASSAAGCGIDMLEMANRSLPESIFRQFRLSVDEATAEIEAREAGARAPIPTAEPGSFLHMIRQDSKRLEKTRPSVTPVSDFQIRVDSPQSVKNSEVLVAAFASLKISLEVSSVLVSTAVECWQSNLHVDEDFLANLSTLIEILVSTWRALLPTGSKAFILPHIFQSVGIEPLVSVVEFCYSIIPLVFIDEKTRFAAPASLSLLVDAGRAFLCIGCSCAATLLCAFTQTIVKKLPPVCQQSIFTGGVDVECSFGEVWRNLDVPVVGLQGLKAGVLLFVLLSEELRSDPTATSLFDASAIVHSLVHCASCLAFFVSKQTIEVAPNAFVVESHVPVIEDLIQVLPANIQGLVRERLQRQCLLPTPNESSAGKSMDLVSYTYGNDNRPQSSRRPSEIYKWTAEQAPPVEAQTPAQDSTGGVTPKAENQDADFAQDVLFALSASLVQLCNLPEYMQCTARYCPQLELIASTAESEIILPILDQLRQIRPLM